MHAVREPDVRAEEAEVLQQLQRPTLEGCLAIRLLVESLGDVRVKADVATPRECRRLAHQPLRDGEGRAGADRDPPHRAGIRVVEALDGVVGGREDGVDVLDHSIRWEAATRLAEVHRSAAGVESHAELLRDLDLGLEQADDARRKDIVVIGRCRAAAERQLGETDLGGDPLPVGIDRRPYWIELAEPVEEAALLGMDPREGLVEMVVRIDQPWHRDQATAIDDVRLLPNRGAALANPVDHSPVDQDGTILQLRAGVVHGDDDAATVEQDHAPARQVDRIDNLLIAGTAAEIATERLAQRRRARVRVFLQQVGDGHDETRRAEAALHRARFEEGLLDRMQALARGQALDGAHVALVGLRRQHQAAAGERAVEPDRARSALALLAGVFRAVETERLAKEDEQAGSGPDVGLSPVAVDARSHNHVGSLRSASAQPIARRASTRQPWRR